MLWWPGEVAGVEAGLHQTDAQTLKASLGKRHRLGLVARWRPHGDFVIPLARGEIDQLPFGSHLGGEVGERRRLDDDAEHTLVEALGEQELSEAPLRCGPFRRDQEDHQLAAFGGLLQGLLPPLACL